MVMMDEEEEMKVNGCRDACHCVTKHQASGVDIFPKTTATSWESRRCPRVIESQLAAFSPVLLHAVLQSRSRKPSTTRPLSPGAGP